MRRRERPPEPTSPVTLTVQIPDRLLAAAEHLWGQKGDLMRSICEHALATAIADENLERELMIATMPVDQVLVRLLKTEVVRLEKQVEELRPVYGPPAP